MKNIRRFVLSLAVISLFSGVSMALPSAAHGQSGSNDMTTTEGQTLAQQYKAMAKSQLQALRDSHQGQSQQHRQQACEARKANLTLRMGNAVRFATNHKAVFDKIYTRVQNFYTSKQLNVSNYDSLKTAVDTAQTNAQAQINALSALQVNVDCSSQTVADSIATFQQAVKSTRDSLKTYRAALVNLIKALKGASTSTNATNSTENSANTTNATNQ